MKTTSQFRFMGLEGHVSLFSSSAVNRPWPPYVFCITARAAVQLAPSVPFRSSAEWLIVWGKLSALVSDPRRQRDERKGVESPPSSRATEERALPGVGEVSRGRAGGCV